MQRDLFHENAVKIFEALNVDAGQTREVTRPGIGDIPVPHGEVGDNEELLPLDDHTFDDILTNRSEDIPEGLLDIIEEIENAIRDLMDKEPLNPDELSRRIRPIRRDEKFEPCAWYAPVHYFGENWGIFIRESCVKHLLRDFLYHCLNWKSVSHLRPTEVVLQARTACFLHVYFHEQFHHKIESLGFRALMLAEKDRYMRYHRYVYSRTLLSPDCLEESLANADAYMRFSELRIRESLDPNIISAIKEFSKAQMYCSPPGYLEGIQYLTKGRFSHGLGKLQSQFVEATISPMRIPNEMWVMAPQLTRGMKNIKAKIYTIVDKGSPSIFGPTFDPKYTASSKKLCAAISKYYGFVKKRGGKGSHEKYEGDDFRGQRTVLTIPGRRESLSIGIIKHVVEAICGKADITLIGKVLDGSLPKKQKI